MGKKKVRRHFIGHAMRHKRGHAVELKIKVFRRGKKITGGRAVTCLGVPKTRKKGGIKKEGMSMSLLVPPETLGSVHGGKGKAEGWEGKTQKEKSTFKNQRGEEKCLGLSKCNY